MIREKVRTDRGRDLPSVRQVSIFVENRVGMLAELLGIFEGVALRILALNVVYGVDCAILRMVFSDTDEATNLLVQHNYRFTLCDLVAVEMPPVPDGLCLISKALLAAEIDIHYMYALITGPRSHAAIVIHVDNSSLAARVMAEHRLRILDERDLRS